MAWFVLLLIALAFTAVAYVIMPKPKVQKPLAAQDLNDPVADAGRPIGVPQGTITISGINVLWFGDKSSSTYMVDS